MLNLIKTGLAIMLAMSINVWADEKIENVRANLGKILPKNVTIETIEPSPMEGVYTVKTGSQLLYVYSAGDFVMVGEVYDAVRKVSLAEERKSEDMLQAISDIPESEFIAMGEPLKRYVTVFTDTDCSYCQQFHKTVPELQSRGMQVRYLMFPRAGLQSDSYHEAVSVWCSDNQGEAMTLAKSGGTVEPKVCENPVAKQYQLGRQLGVRGTPTMILDNGKMIPGFVKPDELLTQAGVIE